MFRLFMIALSAAVILFSLICYVASRAFPDVWWIEISTHFVPQQLIVTFLSALVLTALVLRGSKRIVSAAFVVASFVGLVAADRLIAALALTERARSSEATNQLQIISFNVLTSNPNKAEVLSWLKATIDPQRTTVVFLPETDAAWLQALEEIKTLLPFGLEHPREDNYGFALYSSVALSDAQVERSSEGGVPMLTARISGSLGPVRLIGAHTKAPVNAQNLRFRDSQLRDLRKIVDESDEPAIIMGDLNCSSWSPGFSRNLGGGKNTLFNPFPGIFRSTTWRPFRVVVTTPIDHILFTRHFSMIEARVEGADLGSDHQPVVVTIGSALKAATL